MCRWQCGAPTNLSDWNPIITIYAVLMVASIATLKAIILWNISSVASARYHHRLNFPSSFVAARGNSFRNSMRPTTNFAMANNLPPPNKQDNDNDGHDNDDDVENMTNLDQKIDNLLDKPFFDPYAPSNDNNWFANLVRNDYESAEALYAGVIVILGVVISQQLLRIVKHGGGDINSIFHYGNGQLF